MEIKKTVLSIAIFFMACITKVNAQDSQDFAKDFAKKHQFNLNENGTHYLKLSGLVQAWARYLDYNPGSEIFGYAKSSGVDFGLRRYRILIYGQLTDRVFFFTQFGENNFNNISDRKMGFFVHDAYGEYSVVKTKLSVGVGLSAWNGLSRFTTASTTSILGIDVPLFLEPTADVTDQFGRKLGAYAKGKLGKFDYRLIVSQPMAIQKTSNPVVPGANSSFSAEPPGWHWNGYFMWQFKDIESNLLPTGTGTYLGKKSVFNIGAGFVFQKDAMWRLKDAADPNSVIKTDMAHFSADIFYDAPMGKKGQSVSAYGNYTHYDYGLNYIRNSGPMNPATGSREPLVNAIGNSFPAYGTGDVLYAQIGYKLKENLFWDSTLMPYASLQHANYDRLNSGMNYWDVGINWLLDGHNSKFTLAYQNRPVFNNAGDQITSKSAMLVQYQISF